MLPPDAYFAGFVDGEGCVAIYRSHHANRRGGRWSYSLMVEVGQVNPEPLVLLQQRFGGTIRLESVRSSPRRRLYRWRLYGGSVEPFLRALLPYLIVKRRQAEVALEFRSTFAERVRCGAAAVPPSVATARQRAYEAMRELNATG